MCPCFSSSTTPSCAEPLMGHRMRGAVATQPMLCAAGGTRALQKSGCRLSPQPGISRRVHPASSRWSGAFGAGSVNFFAVRVGSRFVVLPRLPRALLRALHLHARERHLALHFVAGSRGASWHCFTSLSGQVSLKPTFLLIHAGRCPEG